MAWRFGAILIGLLLLGGVPRVRAAGETALEEWLRHQGRLETWMADFRQLRTLAALREPLVSEGRVWFAVPGRFRWELGRPVQTIAVRGEREVVILYPRLRRAEVHPLAGARRGGIGDALALLEAGFPRSRQEVDERFEIESLREAAPGVWRVSLRPRSAAARRFITSVALEFVPEELGPRATELRFTDGSTLRNEFKNTVINPELSSDWFEPEIPGDYEVRRDP